MIVGRFTGGGSSNSTYKCYVCCIKMTNSVEAKKKPTKSKPPITFPDEDLGNIEQCHNDHMVVKIEVANFLVCKFLLDNGSSTDLPY